MRPELERLIHFDWTTDETRGGDEHIASILKLNLTAAERKELCALMESTTSLPLVGAWAGVMRRDPRPEYRDALKKALKSENPRIVHQARASLLLGEYPDGLEIVFSNERALRAVPDHLPSELSGSGNRMTEEMKAKYLDLFCEKFGESTPDLDLKTEFWLRTLGRLGACDDRVVVILRRVWSELHPSDSDGRYLVLGAMAGCADPAFESIFKQAVRSRIEDIRDIAEDALAFMKDNEGATQ